MSTDDLPGALLVRDRVMAIADDEDLSRDAKLFAFCLIAFLNERRKAGRRNHQWATRIGEMMAPRNSAQRSVFHPSEIVRQVIADDVPRYEVPYERSRCPVLKTRGPNIGKPCGRAPSRSWIDFDPETGAGVHVGYCKAHFTDEIDQAHRERWKAWDERGKPTPPANKGGILPRHFEANWDKLYHWAAPHRTPMPEGKPPEIPRPKLKLIRGDMG